PGRHSPSLSCLEPPQSLRSVPPPLAGHGPFLTPYPCWPGGAGCCQQCPNDSQSLLYGPKHLTSLKPVGSWFNHCAYTPTDPRKRSVTSSSPLPLEQRKVFVTYEADSDKHVHEIIQFVALLRRNGFDTRIDVFEQQFKSISKIDFMEKYISEKDYLIIIVISPKYYETVTHSHISMENDENTLNTVYIHKQLQNEFIQNGSKNFRFIPILFPGARKCHVPTWLQNTHIYWWPKDRDDILRRLMRVEKYNPPPIGELPTIVSIPI
uniref:E3 ubiquitin ligase TRAF3IP2 n=1 Tax=Lepisosteus oculatus TaxID=7918 RepID=W5MX33_LEPOC